MINLYIEDRSCDEGIMEVAANGCFIDTESGQIVVPFEPFCQLIQQVALALRSGLWKNKLLGASSTINVWFVFFYSLTRLTMEICSYA